uniref:Uncharacterized protein n=1 Tax=viral metagenome TaxID=1070528 RepID=A0A6H1ZF96_9ZZZZ
MSNQTKTYSDLLSRIGTKLRNASWVSDHPSELLGSVKAGIDDVNAGVTGDQEQKDVGYEFQREIQDIPFDHEKTGTITTAGTTTLTDSAATFQTDGIAPGDEVENTTDASHSRVISVDSETQLTVSTPRNGTDNDFDVDDAYKIPGKGFTIPATYNFKFPYYLTTLADRDIEFTFYEPNQFERKKNIQARGDHIYTIRALPHSGYSQVIQIDYATTEALYFEFFSNNMFRDTSGNRLVYPTESSDVLLAPDQYFECFAEIIAGKCMQHSGGFTETEANSILNSGRRRMMQMINNIGTLRKDPVRSIKLRSGWPGQLSKINDTD